MGLKLQNSKRWTSFLNILLVAWFCLSNPIEAIGNLRIFKKALNNNLEKAIKLNGYGKQDIHDIIVIQIDYSNRKQFEVKVSTTFNEPNYLNIKYFNFLYEYKGVKYLVLSNKKFSKLFTDIDDKFLTEFKSKVFNNPNEIRAFHPFSFFYQRKCRCYFQSF